MSESVAPVWYATTCQSPMEVRRFQELQHCLSRLQLRLSINCDANDKHIMLLMSQPISHVSHAFVPYHANFGVYCIPSDQDESFHFNSEAVSQIIKTALTRKKNYHHH